LKFDCVFVPLKTEGIVLFPAEMALPTFNPRIPEIIVDIFFAVNYITKYAAISIFPLL